MSKFDDYVRIVIETLGWEVDRTINKRESRKLPLDFINDIDSTAKKYGYEASGWGEDDRTGKRTVMFRKIEDENE